MTPEQLADACERWKSDPFTKWLLEQAETDRLNALEALATVEPDDDHGIERLQRRVKFYDWLAQRMAQPGQSAGEFID